MAGFDYTLMDGSRLQLREYEGKRRLDLRRFVNDIPTKNGIWLHETEIPGFLNLLADINKVYEESGEWDFEFNDYLIITCYRSGTLDLRYKFRCQDGRLLYSKKGITLKRNAVEQMFDILCREFQ